MKFIIIPAIISGLLFTACHSTRKTTDTASTSRKANVKHEMLDDRTFRLLAISDDSTYGYTQKNAIAVGGQLTEGARNEQRYLNALTGPNGEAISYNRRGSCCPFKTPNGLFGDGGLLDIYEITYTGLEKPIILYINMYDPGELKAPKGFTFRQ